MLGLRAFPKKGLDAYKENKKMMTTATLNRVDKGNQAQAKCTSNRERVMATSMSVDEYFDELIEHVHEDYAVL